jgi:hypothetical protein
MFDGLSLMSDGKFYVLLLEAPEIPEVRPAIMPKRR